MKNMNPKKVHPEDYQKLAALEKQRVRKFTIYLITYAIAGVLLYWPLRLILRNTYRGAITYLVLCSLLLLCVIITLASSVLIRPKKGKRELIAQIAIISAGTLAMLFMISRFAPLNVKNAQAKTSDFAVNQIYVTYSTSCPYCNKAASSMHKAVNMYNQTHKTPIKLIDLHSSSPLADKAGNYIQFQGSMFILDKDGNFMNSTYTLHGKNNQPKKPSPSMIYQKFVRLAEANDN